MRTDGPPIGTSPHWPPVPLASNLEPGDRRQLITGARREPNKRRVRRRSSAPETAHTHHQSHSGNTRGTFDPAKVFPAHVQGGDYRAWMIETARLGHRPKGLARTARDRRSRASKRTTAPNPRALRRRRGFHLAAPPGRRRSAATSAHRGACQAPRARARRHAARAGRQDPEEGWLVRPVAGPGDPSPTARRPNHHCRAQIVASASALDRYDLTEDVARADVQVVRGTRRARTEPPDRIAHIRAGAERAPAADRLKHEPTLARSGDTRNGSSSASRSAPTARVDSADGNVSPGGAVRGLTS